MHGHQIVLKRIDLIHHLECWLQWHWNLIEHQVVLFVWRHRFALVFNLAVFRMIFFVANLSFKHWAASDCTNNRFALFNILLSIWANQCSYDLDFWTLCNLVDSFDYFTDLLQWILSIDYCITMFLQLFSVFVVKSTIDCISFLDNSIYNFGSDINYCFL